MYGLVGKKLSHSFSPNIHKLIDNYEYKLIEKDEQDIKDFICSKSYKALNITIPYKKTVMDFCDEVSDTAKKIGCVNTIVNKNNKLYGYNTDYYGLISMLKSSQINVKNKKVLILGDGATSQTAQVVLKDMGVEKIIKTSRKKSDLYIQKSYNTDIIAYDEYDKFKDIDVLLNCTPVGMYPDNLKSLVDLDRFKSLQAVCDVVYNPMRTKLILDAQKRSLKISDGLVMLVSQAVYSAMLFTDKNYENLEKNIINTIRKHMYNIVLIGMPGSGKTIIGKKISKIAGKQFVDIDELIEKDEGKRISEIFQEFGEGYFREKERKMILEVSKKQNQVISTGGGCVLNKENYYPLKQNGIIYYIDRKLNELSISARPLSAGGLQSLEKIYNQRYKLYNEFADLKIKNIGIKQTAYKIMEEYSENFTS